MEENIPPWTPPCDSIPWYMTAFQSSPVKICRRYTESSPAVETEDKRTTHDGVYFYLEDSKNRCWECVKVGCRCFVFEIKPAGRKRTGCDQAPKAKHSHTDSSTYWTWSSLLSSPLDCCTNKCKLCLWHWSHLRAWFVRPYSWSPSVYSSQIDELCLCLSTGT